MARVADAILSGAFVNGYDAPMLDLRFGGQDGYAPNLTEWVSHQAYVQRDVIALLIEAPRGFQFLPDPQYWVGAYKSLLELHPKSITGLNAGLKADFVDNAVSGGGEMQQDYVDVKRDRTEPVFTFVEKYGRPIQTFLYEYITNLMMDPDSKVANINTIAGTRPTDLLSDMWAGTVLFFEPDPTHTTVQKAWLTTNFAPMNTGDIVGKRELATAKEGVEFQVNFTGISQSSLGVRLFAQALLNSINFTNSNPNLAPAFVQEIDPDVLAGPAGYGINAESLGANAVVSR